MNQIQPPISSKYTTNHIIDTTTSNTAGVSGGTIDPNTSAPQPPPYHQYQHQYRHNDYYMNPNVAIPTSTTTTTTTAAASSNSHLPHYQYDRQIR